MREMILCKLGEVVLKGLNRRSFEDKLIGNLRRRTAKCGNFRIYSKQSTIYVEPVNDESDLTAAYAACKQVFQKRQRFRHITFTNSFYKFPQGFAPVSYTHLTLPTT